MVVLFQSQSLNVWVCRIGLESIQPITIGEEVTGLDLLFSEKLDL